MKSTFVLLALVISLSAFCQDRVNPVIKSAGGVFEVPESTLKPDPDLPYRIIIELVSASENPKEVNQALNNVARLINLHVSGGAPKENLEVVVAIHGDASYTITDSPTYKKKYKEENPNLDLYKELSKAGVKLYICGQSIRARSIDRATITPEIQVATSMLTTVTTYQLKGYAYLKF